jgi:maltose-binding protein MalE
MIMIIMIAVAMIGFIANETMTATAHDYINQTNSTKSDKQKTWLEINKTKIGDGQSISVSNEDFWKIFGPLLEISTNETSGTIE